ncbi:cyclase family protein [Baekduia soli]|uniref:Cyclase family protein n=1 Tax=Baekduia soli TaxID=496014 RepID=A0A5B8U9P4_9ACTN|nr:cyclase family protein [Baekduia soli]QEC49717.1 cyclase family protein [Baekduia soli]
MTGNWNRWGPEDERGAPNLVTGAMVAAAAGLVQTGRVLSLGQLLDPGMPVSEGRTELSHYMERDGGDYAIGGRVMGRSRFSDDVVVMGMHTGTHIDALVHVWYDEELYNGHPQSSVRSRGASRCGIDKLGPIVARGVLLDVAAHRGVDALAVEGGAIGPGELQACAESQGVALGAGDVVLVRTGWLGACGDDGERFFGGEPGIDVDAARWLAERDVAVVGCDNYAVETIVPGVTAGFPVHEVLLRDCGVPLIESVVLDELAASGRHEFLFVVSPLPLRGGTASPVAPLAIL